MNPLVWNDRLALAARGHTQNMLAHPTQDEPGFVFAHEIDGKGPGERLQAVGYQGGWGENLFYDYASLWDPSGIQPEAAVNAWLESPGHRANLLNPWWTEMGSGIQFVPYGPAAELGLYTQAFGDGSGR